MGSRLFLVLRGPLVTFRTVYEQTKPLSQRFVNQGFDEDTAALPVRFFIRSNVWRRVQG